VAGLGGVRLRADADGGHHADLLVLAYVCESADEVRTWRASQRERDERAPPFFTAPFYACHALARDAAHCARVAGAVARGDYPSGGTASMGADEPPPTGTERDADSGGSSLSTSFSWSTAVAGLLFGRRTPRN